MSLIERLYDLTEKSIDVTDDLLLLHFPIVNAFIVGRPQTPSGEWFLVDTGGSHTEELILRTCTERFGENSRPAAIVLTHGHFDHIGSVRTLAEEWHVPVYAHQLEMPYLTDKRNYPTPDPTVDDGLIAKLSPMFPNEGIDISYHIHALPEDGTIPGIKEWRWLHTPGHTPGHVSLFRERDGILIAGDAISTVKQESAIAVLTEAKEINGPPKYLTTDWIAAEASVNLISSLNPSIILSSHGMPMKKAEFDNQLKELIKHFKELAKPSEGKFL